MSGGRDGEVEEWYATAMPLLAERPAWAVEESLRC